MTKRAASKIILALLAALLVLNIVACGSSEPAPDTREGTEEQAISGQDEGASTEEQNASGPQILVHEGVGESEASAVKNLAKGSYPCSVVTGLTEDDLAEALSSGSAAIVVVPLDVAARLYNSHGCPCMGIDATSNAAVPVVSVVGNAYFSSDPETVVEYVARHGEAVKDSGLTFYRGSAMNDYLVDAMNSLYVADSSMVGGQLLPDNFFFLG